MLPIKSKESMNWVMEHAEEIEAAMTMLNKRLKNLSETLDEKFSRTARIKNNN